MVDWVLLAVFVLLAVRGWMRGLIREVIGLAVVIVGLFLAFRLSTPLGSVVESLAGTSADVSRLIAGIFIGNLEMALFGAPTDYDEIRGRIEQGFDELVFWLPDADADTVLPALDRIAELVERARA